jgi:hypothetical protein
MIELMMAMPPIRSKEASKKMRKNINLPMFFLPTQLLIQVQ